MGADERQGQPRQSPSSGGGGLGDILGQILGGGAATPQAQQQPEPSSQPQSAMCLCVLLNKSAMTAKAAAVRPMPPAWPS